MKTIALLLALLLIPISGLGEDVDWYEAEDWRQRWEEEGFFDFCDVQDDTLTVFEGVEALGEASTGYWDFELDEQIELEPKFEDGPCFDRSYDANFRRVALPSTLRFIGIQAFRYYHFEEFTLPKQLEVLESDAFVYCTFDVLRIEAELPLAEIRGSIYDCTVKAYDVPEDHPLYRSIDGVLFSRDGKTLLDYPGGRTDTHYDVPAGVERIEAGAISNEYLQTISLPIGLRSVGDYGFAGCTRLQSIALPLTVTEIGRDIFRDCVSLELVSLPEGLEADREEDGRWVEYYPDDAAYRGDNGDTLGGARSAGIINAPGRLVLRPMADGERAAWKQNKIDVYDSAEETYNMSFYREGKTVYLSHYENGRVSVYEPLGGAYIGTVRYGEMRGWVDIRDVQYIHQETLFTYAHVRPRSPMYVWWNHLPDYAWWIPWEMNIPLKDREYKATLFGAYVRFDEPASQAAFACAIQDADLARVPDGTDNVYGIVYNTDFMLDIPMLAAPAGETVKMLYGGTQVRILEETEDGYRLTDGQDTGWVGKDHVLIVPEEQEAEE